MIDTAGLEEVTDDSLQGRMRRLTERAVEMADVCLFLIDGRVGVTPTDQVFADILRKKNARVILGVNKAEGKAGDSGALEAYSLGLGEPVRLSAEHGEGMDDLYHLLRPIAAEFAERGPSGCARWWMWTCPRRRPSLRPIPTRTSRPRRSRCRSR